MYFGGVLCQLRFQAASIFDTSIFDACGVHQHDRDVVLNGVHTAAFAAFQTIPVRVQDHWLLTDRADQHVKQILGNHGRSIVTRSGCRFRATPTTRHGVLVRHSDAIESLFHSQHDAARWDGSQDSRRYQNSR